MALPETSIWQTQDPFTVTMRNRSIINEAINAARNNRPVNPLLLTALGADETQFNEAAESLLGIEQGNWGTPGYYPTTGYNNVYSRPTINVGISPYQGLGQASTWTPYTGWYRAPMLDMPKIPQLNYRPYAMANWSSGYSTPSYSTRGSRNMYSNTPSALHARMMQRMNPQAANRTNIQANRAQTPQIPAFSRFPYIPMGVSSVGGYLGGMFV